MEEHHDDANDIPDFRGHDFVVLDFVHVLLLDVADLLLGGVDHRFDLRQLGFDHGLLLGHFDLLDVQVALHPGRVLLAVRGPLACLADLLHHARALFLFYFEFSALFFGIFGHGIDFRFCRLEFAQTQVLILELVVQLFVKLV